MIHCKFVHLYQFCFRCFAWQVKDEFQHLKTSHNISQQSLWRFSASRPSIPKTTRKQRCTWCVLQVVCSPIGLELHKQMAHLQPESEFITSRNPERLESNFETVDAVKINRSLSSYRQTYFSERSMKYHQPIDFGNFFLGSLGFRISKKTMCEAYYSRSLQYMADDPSTWANRALVRDLGERIQCQCCENPVGLGVVIILDVYCWWGEG